MSAIQRCYADTLRYVDAIRYYERVSERYAVERRVALMMARRYVRRYARALRFVRVSDTLPCCLHDMLPICYAMLMLMSRAMRRVR